MFFFLRNRNPLNKHIVTVHSIYINKIHNQKQTTVYLNRNKKISPRRLQSKNSVKVSKDPLRSLRLLRGFLLDPLSSYLGLSEVRNSTRKLVVMKQEFQLHSEFVS